MKVIYMDKPGKERGVCYRLLSEFFGVIGSATEVVVDGDAPDTRTTLGSSFPLILHCQARMLRRSAPDRFCCTTCTAGRQRS